MYGTRVALTRQYKSGTRVTIPTAKSIEPKVGNWLRLFSLSVFSWLKYSTFVYQLKILHKVIHAV